jgi:hypothetical protein
MNKPQVRRRTGLEAGTVLWGGQRTRRARGRSAWMRRGAPLARQGCLHRPGAWQRVVTCRGTGPVHFLPGKTRWKLSAAGSH